MESFEESRRAARRAVEIDCEVVVGDESMTMRCEDLSPYGMWLAWPERLPETDAGIDLGDDVVVTLELPKGGGELTVFGSVQRGGMFGMGLEIIGLSELEQALLRRALCGIPPRFPGRRTSDTWGLRERAS